MKTYTPVSSWRSYIAASASMLLPLAGCYAQNLDLSNTSINSGVINGAIYSVDTTHPSGTGIFGRDSGGVFLTIHGKDVEQGYNTSAKDVMDTKRVPQWNHELRTSDLNTVDIGGDTYVPFLLDINEPANKNNLLSLDDVRIFISPNAGISHQSLEDMLSDPNMTLIYSLDTTFGDSNSWVLLDYNRSGSGSGSADMGLFVPADLFAGASASDYVYLYSKFGGDGASAEGGFEEWTLGAGTGKLTQVPEPSGASLALAAGLILFLRRKR